MEYADRWTTVEVEGGIGWVELSRPEKRNAMSPILNAEMVEVLLELDADDDCGVLVLTGAGDSWSAGMDLKEYFREVDGGPELLDTEHGPLQGLEQFLDEKRIRPGLQTYERSAAT